MSDPVIVPAPDGALTPAPVVEGPAAAPEPGAEPRPVKASDGLAADLAAERRKVKAVEKQLEELQRAQLTEQEKLAADYKSAQAELESLRAIDMQTRAAAKAGLPADLATRLRGATVEEMLEDAKTLKKALGAVTPVAGSGDAKAASNTTAPRPTMNDLLRAAASGH